MTQRTRRGFLRAEGLVLMVLLLVSLAVLGWVFVQMYQHNEAEQAALTAAPQTAVTPAPVTAESEQPGVDKADAETAAASLPARDTAALAADIDTYSNTIATLKAQLDLMTRTRDQEHAAATSHLQEQLRALREDMAQQQTQAFLAERELLQAQLRVDSAQEALVRAQNDVRAKDQEILRLRQMLEELSGIEPPMLQPAAYTNAAVDGVRRPVGAAQPAQAGTAAPAAARAPASAEHIGAAASGAEVRAPDVVAPLRPLMDAAGDRPVRFAWQPRPARDTAGTARPARDLHTATRTPADATPAAPTRVTHVAEMPVTDIDAATTALELGESPLETAAVPAGVQADENALQTASADLAAPDAPPRPEFAPEGGARPSLAGMLNGGYRIVCAPFMVPYGVVSGAAAPLWDDPEQGGTTNYLAYGAVQTLALPFSMGFNSIAGAGSGSMDALQGCLDIITLGTYSGTDAPPCILQVLNKE